MLLVWLTAFIWGNLFFFSEYEFFLANLINQNFWTPLIFFELSAYDWLFFDLTPVLEFTIRYFVFFPTFFYEFQMTINYFLDSLFWFYESPIIIVSSKIITILFGSFVLWTGLLSFFYYQVFYILFFLRTRFPIILLVICSFTLFFISSLCLFYYFGYFINLIDSVDVRTLFEIDSFLDTVFYQNTDDFAFSTSWNESGIGFLWFLLFALLVVFITFVFFASKKIFFFFFSILVRQQGKYTLIRFPWIAVALALFISVLLTVLEMFGLSTYLRYFMLIILLAECSFFYYWLLCQYTIK